MKLYIRRNEKDFGPYPIEQVKQLLQEGRLLKNDQASEDKIAWRELDEILDAKNNQASISEPPSIEDLSKEAQEIVSHKSKPVSESAPEESESIAPKQNKSPRSSANKQADDKVTKPISNFQENGSKKSKKKLFGVLFFSLVVILFGVVGVFLSNINSGTMSFSTTKPKLVAVKMVDCEAYNKLMTEEAAKILFHGGDMTRMFHALNQKFTTEGMVEISQLKWEKIEKSTDMYGLKKGHYKAKQSSFIMQNSEDEKGVEFWNICFTFDAEGANAVKNYLDSK